MIILGCIPYDHYVQSCKIGKITQYKHFKGFLNSCKSWKIKKCEQKKKEKRHPKQGIKTTIQLEKRPSCIMEASKIPLVIVSDHCGVISLRKITGSRLNTPSNRWSHDWHYFYWWSFTNLSWLIRAFHIKWNTTSMLTFYWAIAG